MVEKNTKDVKAQLLQQRKKNYAQKRNHSVFMTTAADYG